MRLPPAVFCFVLGLAAAGCGRKSSAPTVPPVQVDGSSTVFPITEAMAEEFQNANPGHRVTIGVSGTGGGFKKLCAGEVAIAGASRPIKKPEIEACARAGVEFIELPIAYDGLVIAVNPTNDWAESMTIAELKSVWSPEAQGNIERWSQVRPGWPDSPLRLFGAGVDSGTYDYFTQAVVGKEHTSRGDYTSSEDDNVLVKGVAGDKQALGFFGYAYYKSNPQRMKAVAIDDGNPANGNGPIMPTPDSVRDGTYQPLSRPIFIYVARPEADRPEVIAFVEFYMTHGALLVDEVGYIPLPADAYARVKARFTRRATGSVFAKGGSQVGMTIEKLLEAEDAP
jgi:phosphate transport system substrate-binding protein